MKTTYSIFGNRVLVKPHLVKKPLTNTEEFNGVVEVLAIGHTFDVQFPLAVGDKLLVTDYQEIRGEYYVLPTQILRKDV